jgi:hypothetical protein
LSVLPCLLPCPQPAAKSLISLIGECGSAKEVVIAAQEILERLDDVLSLEMEEDEKEDIVSESPSGQLISLIHLYNSGRFSLHNVQLVTHLQQFLVSNYAKSHPLKPFDPFSHK